MSAAGKLAGAVGRLTPVLGLRGSRALGTALGALAWAVDGRHREVAHRNLARAFPDWDDARRRRVVRQVFHQAGRTAVEMLWSPALRGRPDAAGPLEGLEHARGALEEGKGIIITSGHFGNWELLALRLGQAGVPTNVVVRRLADDGLEELLLGLRTAGGNRIVYKDEAVRGSLRALGRGEAVALMVDQNTLREQAVFVPFFGKPAATTRLLARLHLRTGAPVVPVFALPADGGYRFVVEPPLPAVDRDAPDAVEQVTAAVTRRIEDRVRRQPEAWLWIHDRWRTRPAPGDDPGERASAAGDDPEEPASATGDDPEEPASATGDDPKEPASATGDDPEEPASATSSPGEERRG